MAGSTFTTALKVRFGHEDHARIVYYPRVFHFFHCAFEDLFDVHAGTYRACLDAGIGWPAVHAEADYRRPLHFGDLLAIGLQVRRIGRSSVTFEYVVKRGGDAQASVIGKVIVVCTDMTTLRSIDIPPKYRALFEAHLVEQAPS